jgi:hypothetical protein
MLKKMFSWNGMAFQTPLPYGLQFWIIFCNEYGKPRAVNGAQFDNSIRRLAK